MAYQLVPLQTFNRGLCSQLGLARTDVKHTALAAEIMVNWMPRILGSMMLRPGLGYKGEIYQDLPPRLIDFEFSTSDTALLELTNQNLRVWINDVLVTRPVVTSAVTNGTFSGNLNNWTQADQAGATSAWVAGNLMGLTGDNTGTNYAKRQQTVTNNNPNVEHALRIVVNDGPVTFRLGTAVGLDDIISQQSLDTGTHSLAFTPIGNFVIEFSANFKRQVLVTSCTIEAAGVMVVPTPWLAADLGNIRTDQSASIVFSACAGYKQQKIERRAAHSWSVVNYQPQDGPFLIQNVGATTIAPSALNGNVTLTASAPLFYSTHVGALFSITSVGQDVTASIAAQNLFTNAIKVTNVGAQRAFAVIISGTWTATVTLQQSTTSETGPWVDVKTWVANTTENYNDTLDNQIIWYRIGIKTGNYTNGTANVELKYAVGSIVGICRITAYTDSTHVNAEVFTDFGGTTASTIWSEGQWSNKQGWPSAVGLYESRLYWSGKNGVAGSIVDAYYSYNQQMLGDSGPIIRTIGSGPVDTINWMLALQRLLFGAQGAEFVCQSSSLDIPLTPSDFAIKTASTQGSGSLRALKLDRAGIFVQRGGVRVYEISTDNWVWYYNSNDLTTSVPEIGKPGIVRIAIQRQPDTRVHCVRSDGTVAMLVFDRAEQVTCWHTLTTDGLIEDVCVLPGADGTNEDAVYYVVNRTINGVTKRYLERFAMESECVGGMLNKQFDSFTIYSGVATTVITGLGNWEAKTVGVWGNGIDLGTYVVTGAQITVSQAVSNAVVGLVYTAQWKSTKLAYASQLGTALNQKKRVNKLGVILLNTHWQGLKYGPDFNSLDDLPQIYQGTPTATDAIYTTYDGTMFEFDGEWDTDSRLCLQAQSPRPCNILAAVVAIEEVDRT